MGKKRKFQNGSGKSRQIASTRASRWGTQGIATVPVFRLSTPSPFLPYLLILLTLTGLCLSTSSCDRQKDSKKRSDISIKKQKSSPTSGPLSTQRLDELWDIILNKSEESSQARRELAAMGSSAIPFLLSHIEDDFWRARWEAVNSLGMLEDKQATEPLIERILRDDNLHVRWRALWALHAVGNPASPDKIREHLNSEDSSVRWNAAVALGFFRQKDAAPYLKEGLTNPDAWIRWEAVNGLGRAFDEETVELLIPFLNDPDPKIRRETVTTFGRIGNSDAVAQLIKLLDNEDPEIRWRAAMGLGRSSDISARKALENRLKVEEHENTRKNIEKAIQRLGGRDKQR